MQNLDQIPGLSLFDYALIISPGEELASRVQKIKNELSENYKVQNGKAGRPHILLVNFTHTVMMEEKIMHRLQGIAMGITPFKIECKDFGSYPSHSIYINVTSKLPLQQLTRELKTAQQLMKLNAENKPHFLEEHHLLIGKKLKPWQYEQGWLEYSKKHFSGRFIADSMLLLKRPAGEKTSYQAAKRFEFLNQPITTRQGQLFG